MNSSQIHLALTHVPVILSLVGLVLLVFAFIRKNETMTRISFYVLLLAGIFAIPVYLTGEGSEEIVEELPGVSEGIIERHEDVAKLALIIVSACGALALAGLLLLKNARFASAIKLVVLFLAIGAVAAMVQTAHLGGQIRHSEIRSAFLSQSATEKNAEGNGEGESEAEHQEESQVKSGTEPNTAGIFDTTQNDAVNSGTEVRLSENTTGEGKVDDEDED